MNIRKYNRRTRVSRPYVGLDNQGRMVACVLAYNAKEAKQEMVKNGYKVAKVVRS